MIGRVASHTEKNLGMWQTRGERIANALHQRKHHTRKHHIGSKIKSLPLSVEGRMPGKSFMNDYYEKQRRSHLARGKRKSRKRKSRKR